MRRAAAIIMAASVCLLVLTGCSSVPDGVLPPGKMASLLADMEIGESVVESDPSSWRSDSLKMVLRQSIYERHGVTSEEVDSSLAWYGAHVEKMPEDQKCIYFAAGDDTDRLGKLPNAQLVLSKGYDLLLCTEDVDEFCLQMMRDYKEKEFKNINSGDLGLETEDEKKAAEAAETENKDLFEEIKKDLNGKVKEVKVNPTLQEHPVTLSAEGGISMEMEKVLRRMPNAEGVESTKVLELNPNHTVFAALKAAHAAGDTDKVAKYAELLYDQALLIAGLPIEDPVAYAQLVCGLMQ